MTHRAPPLLSFFLLASARRHCAHWGGGARLWLGQIQCGAFLIWRLWRHKYVGTWTRAHRDNRRARRVAHGIREFLRPRICSEYVTVCCFPTRPQPDHNDNWYQNVIFLRGSIWDLSPTWMLVKACSMASASRGTVRTRPFQAHQSELRVRYWPGLPAQSECAYWVTVAGFLHKRVSRSAGARAYFVSIYALPIRGHTYWPRTRGTRRR